MTKNTDFVRIGTVVTKMYLGLLASGFTFNEGRAIFNSASRFIEHISTSDNTDEFDADMLEKIIIEEIAKCK